MKPSFAAMAHKLASLKTFIGQFASLLLTPEAPAPAQRQTPQQRARARVVVLSAHAFCQSFETESCEWRQIALAGGTANSERTC